MNILTILVTVIIINWSFRTPATHKMPAWVRFVFLNFLPKILFMKRPENKPPIGKRESRILVLDGIGPTGLA